MKVVSVIWAIVRGLLRAISKDFAAQRRKTGGGAAKERPWWAEEPAPTKEAARRASAAEPREAAPKEEQAPEVRATAPGWWGKPAPPKAPPTIKVETDEGTFVAAATFAGDHMMGVRRVERPRQEGESRRRRRSAPKSEHSPVVQCEVEACPREPDVPIASVEPTPEAGTAEARREDTTSTAITPHTGPGAQSSGRATPIDPSERPRVDRATRVRSRLGPPEAPWTGTTLATRLALTEATRTLARKGDRA